MPLSFLLRFDRPFFWPAAGLTPETRHLPFLTTYCQKNLAKNLLVTATTYYNIFFTIANFLAEGDAVSRCSSTKSVKYPVNLVCPVQCLPNEISIALISSGRSLFNRGKSCLIILYLGRIFRICFGRITFLTKVIRHNALWAHRSA
jgi:hypothetical protein